MKTFERVLIENNQIGPGFDFLRVFLALSIVCFHSLSVTNQYYVPYSLDDTAFWIVHYSLVPMFFALSGFLISASAGRLSLKNFLINRGMRIVPALAVDTLVCALLIGPLFTTVDLHQYFFSKEFATFFLNVVGWVHFTLPGVFVSHPIARVNGSLWTVPFELACYASISLMIVTGLIKGRFTVLFCVVAYLLVSIAIQSSNILNHLHLGPLTRLLNVAFIEHEAQAVTAFLFGIVVFQNKDKIPYSVPLFASCVVILLVFAFSLTFDQGQLAIMRFALLPCLVYVTVFVGLTQMPLLKFFRTGDYSYGIYLYHMPFLQIVAALFPIYAFASPYRSVFTLFVGLPFIIGVAWLSWHFVEKPLLAMRKRFSLVAKHRAQQLASPDAATGGELSIPAAIGGAVTPEMT